MADPAVSVVLLTYNHADYVAEAVGSILQQDLVEPWEVIVADDCSPDGTAAIVADLSEGDPRFRILDTPRNLGMQDNLRRAMRASTGRYVAFLEGDDYWTSSTKLAAQCALLDAEPAVSAAGHRTEILMEDSGRRATFAERLGSLSRLDTDQVLGGLFPHASSLVFRRALLPETPAWFDGLASADWPIVALLSLEGDIAIIDETMSVYRKNKSSSWTPRPQLERKEMHLRGLREFERNAGLNRRRTRSHIADAHAVVAAVARHDGKYATAARNAALAVIRDPSVVRRRLRRDH